MTEQPPPDHAESSSSVPQGPTDQLNQMRDEDSKGPYEISPLRAGFVKVRGEDHYAMRIHGDIWRSLTSAEMIYAQNLPFDPLVRAGAEVALTFRVQWVPIELGRTRYGRCINITKYRRRGRE